MIFSFRKCASGALGLLLGSPAALAQSTVPSAAAPGWYVGVQAGNELCTYTINRQGNGLRTNSVAVYGGYAVAPRLTVQAGIQYGRGDKPDEELQGSGSFAHYPQTAQITRAWAVPVQARWAFTDNPHRFQLEGIAGARLCFFRQRETGTNSADATKYEVVQRRVNGFLDLGIGGRFRLGSQLDLTADLLGNLNVVRPSNSYYLVAPGFGSALGLRYRLN